MTLIVEDGTRKPDAEAYCSVAFADAWHLSRGMTTWATMSEAEKEAAIRRATHFMLQAYRLRWHGWRATSTQALDWPRVDVPIADGPAENGLYDDDVVPIEVQQANAELAFKAASGDLMPDVDKSSAVKREKVDVIEVEYRDNAPLTARYQSVEDLLAVLLKTRNGASGGGSMSVVRA